MGASDRVCPLTVDTRSTQRKGAQHDPSRHQPLRSALRHSCHLRGSIALASAGIASADTAYGATGPNSYANVWCDQMSTTVSFAGFAGAATGYSQQWIAAYLTFTNLYTGRASTYGPLWINSVPLWAVLLQRHDRWDHVGRLQPAGGNRHLFRLAREGLLQRTHDIRLVRGNSSTGWVMLNQPSFTQAPYGTGLNQCMVGTRL
jgi:hypothetical protein